NESNIIEVKDGPLVSLGDPMNTLTDTSLVTFNGAYEELRFANKRTVEIKSLDLNDDIRIDLPTLAPALTTLKIDAGTGRDIVRVTPHNNDLAIEIVGDPVTAQDTLHLISGATNQYTVNIQSGSS